MTLDPQIAQILPLLASAPPLSDPVAARAGMRVFTVDMRDPSTLAPVRSSEDTTYPTPNGPRKARVYRPEVEGATPTVLFLHGGGYGIGDIDNHGDLTLLIRDRD